MLLAHCLLLISLLDKTIAKIELAHGLQCKTGSSDIVLGQVSYVTCLNECKARDACTGVSYHAMAHVCIVHGEDAVEKTQAECKGYVYSGKSEWLQPQLLCASIDCDYNRAACLNTDICQYTDCPVPVQTQNGLVLLGNTRVPGSKIVYLCDRPLTLVGAPSLTCLDGGVWSHPFPSCQSVTTQSTSSISTGTGNIQSSQTTTKTPTKSTTSTTSATTEASVGSTTITTDASTMQSTSATGLSCADGWAQYQSSCYQIDASYRNFDATQTFCSSLGAIIAVPDTVEENTFIKSFFSGLFDYWIGIKLDSTAVSWITTNSNLQPLSYNDWHDGVIPVDPLTQCATYLRSMEYRWTEQSCTMNAHALCEKPAV